MIEQIHGEKKRGKKEKEKNNWVPRASNKGLAYETCLGKSLVISISGASFFFFFFVSKTQEEEIVLIINHY